MKSDSVGPLALVVDDDPVNRLLVRRALEGFGCREVLQAANGEAAQATLGERTDIDLVVTDIMMPGVDGLELLRWGRERHPGMAWIILSGLDTFDTAVEAIRLGAFDFLAKPPRIEELEVSVRNALERRRLVEERERLNEELASANEQLRVQVRELEDKSELLRRDLVRAEIIQRALLPSDPPAIDRFSVHAVYRPGQYVGGDLYDVVRLGDHHLAIYVADATGHGVSAAMLSVLFKQRLVLTDGNGTALRPAQVLSAVNDAVMEAHAAPGLFLTAAYCVLDTKDGVVTIASAGHPPVVHVGPGGKLTLIRRTGPALGLSEGAEFAEVDVKLGPRDRLLLYTDGLLQAGVTPESESLQDMLEGHGAGDGLLSRLLAAATSDAEDGGSRDGDDVTLLLLDVRAGPSHFDNGTGRSEALPRPAVTAPETVFYGETNDASYLALRGRATWSQSDAFYEAASGILEIGRPLVIDLSACDYLDSTFLGTVHELEGRGDVKLQGAKPEVRALFEELSMDSVLTSMRDHAEPLPELKPLRVDAVERDGGKRRILRAHESLAAISASNREKFAGVIESLRDDASS